MNNEKKPEKRKWTEQEKGKLTLIIAVSLALIITVTASALSKYTALKASDEWGDDEIIYEEIIEEAIEPAVEDPTGEFSNNAGSQQQNISANDIQDEAVVNAAEIYAVFKDMPAEDKTAFLPTLDADTRYNLLKYICSMEYEQFNAMDEQQKADYLSVYTEEDKAVLLSGFAELAASAAAAAEVQQTETAETAETAEQPVQTPAVTAEQLETAKKNYEYFNSLDDAEKQKYLDSLSPEDQLALIEYIDTAQNNTAASSEQAETAETKPTESPAPAAEQTAEPNPAESPAPAAVQNAEPTPTATPNAETEQPTPSPAQSTSEQQTENQETKPEEAQNESTSENTAAAAEPEVQQDVKIWYEYEGAPRYGMTVKINSAVSGFSDNVRYKWMYSTDGQNWTVIEGANGPEFSFTLDSDTVNYRWRLVAENA